jgi:hypothetical protein
MKRQQSGLKGNRAKILDQLKALQESSQARVSVSSYFSVISVSY